MSYFLDIEICNTVIAEWTSRKGQPLSEGDRLSLLVHYAEHDSSPETD